MRILFITQWFDPEPNTARGLPFARWLTERGHEVEVLTGFPNYPGGKVYPGYQIRARDRRVIDGVSVLRVPLYPSHSDSAIGRVLNYGSFALAAAGIGIPSTRRADVAFVYHPPASVGVAALLLKRLRGTPFVYHIADLWPESVVESGMVRSARLRQVVGTVLNAWCATLYERAAAITVTTPGFKRLLCLRGVPAEKVHVIYHWTDGQTFVPAKRDEALAAELGMAGRFNILYAGNVGLFQDIETIVRAAKLLRDVPEIQIVIAGSGVRLDAVRSLAVELGVDNVRFLPRRPYWEMPAINALADVLLVHLKDLPFFRSTIPGKTQVSLASGRPMLMAVRGDAADIVEAAGAGVTCRPEDPEAMAAAIRDLHALEPGQREAMGRRGRDFYLREMSMEVGAARTEGLFHGVARGIKVASAETAVP